jgi:16S rRNA (guanine527-N7)-methyltransferase
MLFSMQADAMRDLLAAYVPGDELDDYLLESVGVHLELLLRWNQRMNLTGLRTPEAILGRHFGESLFVARLLLARNSADTVLDIGSGAGFPGLPIKYWSPSVVLTLVEGHGKKATFLREVCRALPHLSDVVVLNSRSEALISGGTRADLVTLRAVERFEEVLSSAASLVAPGGRLALLIGESQRDAALQVLHPGETSTVPLPSARERILLTWRRPTSS